MANPSNADALRVRDSEKVEALLAAQCSSKLLAITHRQRGAIALEELPLARIKRIMKQDACDPQPRMVAAETIPLMAFSAQLFIGSLTALAWQLSTTNGRRNTMQAKDLKFAVHASRRFDFLIDTLDLYDQSVAPSTERPSGPVPVSRPMPLTHDMPPPANKPPLLSAPEACDEWVHMHRYTDEGPYSQA